MTTIACDGKSMAGDGQAETCHTIITTEAIKVRRLNDGRIIGSCGEVAYAKQVIAWLNGEGDKPDKSEDDFAALILNVDGSIEHIGGHCVPTLAQSPFAIGSGMDFAIGAMECGKTPFEAVQIAARRDPGTGGKITVLERPLRLIEKSETIVNKAA
jgi:ATP-dependent protease HslVU (ClpYQ) peptidase subunit